MVRDDSSVRKSFVSRLFKTGKCSRWCLETGDECVMALRGADDNDEVNDWSMMGSWRVFRVQESQQDMNTDQV